MSKLDVMTYAYAPGYMKDLKARAEEKKDLHKMSKLAEIIYGSPAKPAVTPYANGAPTGVGALLPQDAKKATGVFDLNVDPEIRYNEMQKRMLESGLKGYIETALANSQNMQNSSMSNLGAYQRQMLSENTARANSMETDDTKEWRLHVQLARQRGETPMNFLDWQLKMKRASAPPGETDPMLVAEAKRKIDEYDKMTQSAVKSIEMLDTLKTMESSMDSSLQGGFAEVGRMFGNFLASTGIEAEWIKNTNLNASMQNKSLKTYMEELGARGLTDKDMEILRLALPSYKTDKASQKEIIRIFKKGFKGDMDHYIKMQKRYNSQYKGVFELHPAVESYLSIEKENENAVQQDNGLSKFFNADGTPKRRK